MNNTTCKTHNPTKTKYKQKKVKWAPFTHIGKKIGKSQNYSRTSK
jgi:hypothetical protein